MIEKGTNYSFLVKAEQPLNFQKMKAVSDQFILNLSKDLREKIFTEYTQNILKQDSEPLMAAHLYIYGEILESRLKRAYSYFSKSFFKKEIEIIDYKCGQGIAGIVYNDFLNTNNIQQKIRRITLIDPSEMSLRRACLHTRLIFPNVELRIVCKKLDDLRTKDIIHGKNITKLHLLMDIPDLNAETLIHLSKIIKANIRGLNYFICVGEYNNDNLSKREKLNHFIEMMNPDNKLRYAEDLEAFQLVAGKPWTCSLRTFMKNESKDGEFIIDKSIKYWITKDNIRYSENKKRLVKCPYSLQGEFVLPDFVNEIDSKAFRGCDQLTKIIADNNDFISIDGILYSDNMRRLIRYPQAKKSIRFNIPDNVYEIEAYAFAGCTMLEEIILPDGITKLGFGAFEYCTNLKIVKIPPSVVRIEGSVFASCKALSTVFFDPICCESMENIETDSEGVSCYEALAFEGCTSLTHIHIGENVTVIPDFAFSFCEYISSIVLPESILYIGRNSFSYCKKLEKIEFKSLVANIGKDAFFWCKNLHQVLVPKGLFDQYKKIGALKDFIDCIDEKNKSDKSVCSLPHTTERITATFKSDKIKSLVQQSVNPEPSTGNDYTEPKINKSDENLIRLIELATKGNMKIQNQLGYMYEVGENVDQNTTEAVKWYRMAAEQGYAKAQFNLANQYALGNGVKKDANEAKKWYLKAATQGEIAAMNNLGVMYAKGFGVTKNEIIAIEWYRKAAEKGDKTAIRNLLKKGLQI